MPYHTANQVLRPTNPTLVKDLNIPREKGQTRVLPDGSLLYREPIMGEEVPVVRLEDIRPRLVEEASQKLSYRFPKKRGYEDTNVTAFVKKDYNYGPKRENRPDRLFQIQSDGTKGEKPDGYAMDRGRIVLDAFDHGLRNFGNQLPMYVSSELEGHDIEDYLRRNREISVYDLVARAPNGYYQRPPRTKNKIPPKDERAGKWHEGPPRVGTFSMRATRFRLGAGCLSWEKKDGTAAKNQRILDVIPAQYKDPAVNSTKGWRDLNKAEIKRIRDGAMRKPQQGPKAKRAAQTVMVLEKKFCPVEDSAEGGDFLEEGEGAEYEAEDAWNDAPNEQNNDLWPGLAPEGSNSTLPIPHPSQVNLQNRGVWQTAPTINGKTSANTTTESSNMGSVQSCKRLRGHSDEHSEEYSTHQAQKRARTTADAPNDGIEGGYTRITTSRMRRPPQQRRQPPYITSRASTHPAVDSSKTVLHRNVDNFYNASNRVNGDSTLPNTFHSNRPPTYASPAYEPQEIHPLERGSTDSSAPLFHYTDQNHPQHPLSPNTSLKRKRTPSSSSKPSHSDGPHPNKHIKPHAPTQPAAALQLQTPTDTIDPVAKFLVHRPSHQLPSLAENWQLDATDILFFPPPGTRNQPSSSQHLFPSALDEEEEEHGLIAEPNPVIAYEEEEEEGEGYTPPAITGQQEETIGNLAAGAAEADAYFPPFDFGQIDQNGHSGLGGAGSGGGREFEYPPADVLRGQWNGARWAALDAGWLIQRWRGGHVGVSIKARGFYAETREGMGSFVRVRALRQRLIVGRVECLVIVFDIVGGLGLVRQAKITLFCQISRVATAAPFFSMNFSLGYVSAFPSAKTQQHPALERLNRPAHAYTISRSPVSKKPSFR